MSKFWMIFVVLLILFSCSNFEAESQEARVQKLLQTTKSWNGTDLPDYPDGKPEISILKVSIPPYSELALHKHQVINAGVLVAGELTVITESKDTLRMKTGDALSEVIDTWHYGVNEGDEPAEIIVFYVGTPGTPLSIHATDDKE